MFFQQKLLMNPVLLRTNYRIFHIGSTFYHHSVMGVLFPDTPYVFGFTRKPASWIEHHLGEAFAHVVPSVQIELDRSGSSSMLLLGSTNGGHNILNAAVSSHIIDSRLLDRIFDQGNQDVVEKMGSTTLVVVVQNEIVVTLL
jgi:hypothetical protein